MLVASLQTTYSAKFGQHHFSLLSLQLWDQKPNIHAVLTLLQGSQERAPDNLHTVGLLGGKGKNDSNAGGTADELAVWRRPAPPFCPNHYDVEQHPEFHTLRYMPLNSWEPDTETFQTHRLSGDKTRSESTTGGIIEHHTVSKKGEQKFSLLDILGEGTEAKHSYLTHLAAEKPRSGSGKVTLKSTLRWKSKEQ